MKKILKSTLLVSTFALPLTAFSCAKKAEEETKPEDLLNKVATEQKKTELKAELKAAGKDEAKINKAVENINAQLEAENAQVAKAERLIKRLSSEYDKLTYTKKLEALKNDAGQADLSKVKLIIDELMKLAEIKVSILTDLVALINVDESKNKALADLHKKVSAEIAEQDGKINEAKEALEALEKDKSTNEAEIQKWNKQIDDATDAKAGIYDKYSAQIKVELEKLQPKEENNDK